MTGFLVAESLIGGYNQVQILNGWSICLDAGEIGVIVGPNGAGKSTAMKAILGMIPLSSGTVNFDSRDISRISTQARVGLGMGFVPQVRNVFPSMTVIENLEIGATLRKDDVSDSFEEIFSLFPILKTKRSQLVGQLSGGQRQQVAIGRALMTKPKILMLDEPTAGVSPLVMRELFDKIKDISISGVAVLIVEQNAKQALEIADVGFVMVHGKNRFIGSGKELLENPEVRLAFLGG